MIILIPFQHGLNLIAEEVQTSFPEANARY